MTINDLLALGRRLAIYASLIEAVDPIRMRNTIARRLGQFRLGWLPMPVFVGHAAIFVISRPPALAAKAIGLLPPLLGSLSIAPKELIPYKVEAMFLASGRTEEAIAYCHEFLARHPDAHLAALLLIDLYLSTDRIRDALDIMRTMSHSCESAEGLYGVGRRLMNLTSVDHIIERTAIAGVQRAVQKLNRELQGEESYRSIAKRCLDQAIARTSGGKEVHQKARYWRGVLHIQRDEDDLAEQDFRAIVNRGRRYVFAYAFLADIYERRGQLQQAVSVLQATPGDLSASLPIVERLIRLRVAVGDVRGALDTVGRPPTALVAHIVADVR